MPESPLLARHAVIAAGTAIGFGEVDGYEAGRALLAAHDPDELARRFEEERLAGHEARFLREFARWLGLGDVDAD